MVHGFRLKGSHGAFQIDNSRTNFVFKQKGTASMTLDAAWGVSPVVSCSISVTAVNPVLAVSCSAAVTVQYATVSGSTWTFYVTANTGTAQTLDWYLFDDAANTPKTVPQWGFRIWNRTDTSKVVLHSGQLVAKGVDAITAVGTSTYTSGRTYAVAFAECAKRYTSTQIGPTSWRNIFSMRGARVSGASVITRVETYENYVTTTDQGTWGTGAAVVLVFDVTGY